MQLDQSPQVRIDRRDRFRAAVRSERPLVARDAREAQSRGRRDRLTDALALRHGPGAGTSVCSPSSTSTSRGRAASRVASARIATPSSESAQQSTRSPSSAASSCASRRTAAASVTALAISTVATPASTATSACQGVATEIPHAPASSSRCHSAGAMVVLPCGASSTPCSRAQAKTVSSLCDSASACTVSTGVTRSERRRPASGTSERRSPAARAGKPFVQAPRTGSGICRGI